MHTNETQSRQKQNTNDSQLIWLGLYGTSEDDCRFDRLYTFQYLHLQRAEMNPRAKDLNIQLQGVLSQVNIPEIDETFKGSLTLFPQYDIYTSC